MKLRKLGGQQRPADRQEVEIQELLTDQQKILLFASLTRDESLFRTAASSLQTYHFSTRNIAYGLVWSTILAHWRKFDKLPDGQILNVEIGSRKKTYGYLEMSSEDDGLVEAVLRQRLVQKPAVIDTKRQELISYLQRFLNEAINDALRRNLYEEAAVALPQLLDRFADEARKVESISAGDMDLAFGDESDEEWMVKPVSKSFTPTGSDYLDFYMGGQADGEVYGFVAPFGVCKTTQTVKLGVDRARWELARWVEAGSHGPIKKVYLFFYEEPLQDVRMRALCYAAHVPKTSLEHPEYPDNLSSSAAKNYKDYERKMYKEMLDSGLCPPGERERLLAARKDLNQVLRLVDFTGNKPEYRAFAATMENGIREVIEKDQREHKGGVSLVAVDYAGAAADAHCQANRLDPVQALRPLIGKFPLRLGRMIAVPFGCPVWVTHQVSTEGASKAPGATLKLTDTKDAKDFFENTTFAFLVGPKTRQELATLTSKKQRRAASKRDTVLYIDGEFATIRDASHEYSATGKEIVLQSELNDYVDPATADWAERPDL